MARGVRRARPNTEIDIMPVSDGGDGLIDALSAGFSPEAGGRLFSKTVRGPLGAPVRARYLMRNGNCAVIETARCCGLALLKGQKLRPLEASSFGAGEFIAAALEKGARRILIGLGGAASCDGGAGIAQALGARLLDENSVPVAPGARGLLRLAEIDTRRMHPLVRRAGIIALADVTNPLLGENGSARVYGPQKGATPKEVEIIETALRRYARIVKRDLGLDISRRPSMAAAGAMAAGLYAFCGARMACGAQTVLQMLNARRRARAADIILTGEGRLDAQTLCGKTPFALAQLGAECGKPVFAVAGSCALSPGALRRAGFAKIVAICGGATGEKQSMRRAAAYAEAAAFSLFSGL